MECLSDLPEILLYTIHGIVCTSPKESGSCARDKLIYCLFHES
jgi:hypothetical protein